MDLRLDGESDPSRYKQQDDRLTKEIEAVSVDLRQADTQFLDLDGVLTFAEQIVISPVRLWLINNRRNP